MTIVDVTPSGVPLLPADPPRLGPVSRRLVLRLVAIVAVIVVTGTALVIADPSPRWRAIGLSLVLPGGGLLYQGRPLEFVLLGLVMVLAVVLWWGLSAWWGIPLVWLVGVLVTAALAGAPRLLVADGTTWPWAIPAVYLIAASLVAIGVSRFERAYRAKRSQVAGLNEYLATAALPTPATPLVVPTEFDGELLRWAYAMALQPLDEFEGFDWGEQFHGPTCARYQLNMLGYALALFAANYVPNAPRTVERALANLIDKQTDLRVWQYWRTLNLIGNLDRNPDPIVRDNIMLSAYVADQINLYEAATGSTRFDEPGSLTFVWRDGRTFAYDHHSITEAVQANFEANDLGLFPCEPGWVFTFCNVMGAQALKGHDTLHGTALWAAVEQHWRNGVVGEMLTPDGHFPHIRSKLIGLSFDTGEVPNGEYYSAGTNRLWDVAPDLALRGALLNLRTVPEQLAALRGLVDDGVLQHHVTPRLERNTLIRTAVLDWTGIVGIARAGGDEELAQAALRAMERDCATGLTWPERPLAGGAQTVGIHLMGRWATPLGTADLALRGYEAPTGPLVDAPWPDLVVTMARSHDARSLEVVVEPGPGGGCGRLTFSELVPGAAYRTTGLDGTTVVADGDGTADVLLSIGTRTVLHVEPVDAS